MTRTGNTIQINVSIPKELDAQLRIEAKKENRSYSNFIAHLLIEAMKTPGPKVGQFLYPSD